MAYNDSYENDNSSSNATAISIGALQTHSLTSGDVDWVKFYVSSSGTYTVETTGDSNDTVLYLYDASLNEVDHNDDINYSGGQLNSRITKSLSSGWYYAKVYAYGTKTVDSYGIRVTSASSGVSADSYENDNSRFNAKTISVGQTQSHSIHIGSDEDWLKFTVASDGFYSIVTSGGDTILDFYTMEGQYCGSNDDRGNGNLGSFSVMQLYANTSYYVRVRSYGSKTFDYTVSLTSGVVADTFESNSDGSRTTTSTSLSVGSSQWHTLHTASDVDWIKVNVSTAGSYALTVSTGDRDANKMLLEVYNSSGTRLAYMEGLNPYCYGNLVAGTYYMKVTSASGVAAGSYLAAASKNDTTDTSFDSYEVDDLPYQAKEIALSSSQTSVTQNRSLTIYTTDSGSVIPDTDWVKFTPTVTGLYRFSVSGTSAATKMTLYTSADTDDKLLIPVGGDTQFNPYVENYLVAGMTYYLSIEDKFTMLNIPSYSLTLERKSAYTAEADSYESDNTRTTAKTLTLGAAQAHSLHTATDQDWMKFTPTVSDYYTFYTGARNGGAGDGDLMLGLYDSSGKLLVCDDDSGAGYNAMVTYSLSAGSTYYLVALSARDNQVVPFYTVTVARGVIEDGYDIYMDERSTNDNTRANAIPIAVGSNLAHTIHSSSDVDWVQINVDTSGYYTLETSGSGDTVINFYDANGNFLQTDDDSGVGRNARVTRYLSANTNYYAKVSAYNGTLVPLYNLAFSASSGGSGDAYENDDTKANAHAIVAGETQSHTIHSSTDVDWTVIRPIQAGTYQIQTSGDGDMKLELYNAAGQLLASDDDSGVGLNARVGQVLNANTDYYIKAYAYNGALVENYGLSVALMVGSELGDEYENDDSPNAAKPISIGETQSHSIHIAGDVDWVTFTPTVSAEYTIQTVGSGLNCDTQLYIYDSLASAQSGSYWLWDDDSGSDRNALVSHLMTAGKTYYIKAKAWSDYTIPSYGLKVTQNNGTGSASYSNGDEYESDNLSGECKPIAVGKEYSHSIHLQSDTDWVRFYTHQTGTYTIQTTGGADMSFIVYKRIPGGALVPYENGQEITWGGAGANPLYRVNLESDNWYYVRVTTNGRRTTTSNYGIRVDVDSSSVAGDSFEKAGGKSDDNTPSRATWVTMGASQVHSIHTPGDTDWYVYKSANSTSVVFSAENDFGAEMRLFLYRKESNGSLTFIDQSQYGSYGYTSIALNTQANSTYYVRAQALSSANTVSSYRFTANYVKDGYEDDDTSSKATVLSVGTPQTHNIHSQTDVDWYKITVSSSGTYEFETSGSGDTYGILYRNTSSGNQVVTQTGSGGTGKNMKISASLSTGTYYLRVSGENNMVVDSYTVTARRPITRYDEPNDTRANATALSVNNAHTGSFDTTTDVDYYKVANASAGTWKFTANKSSVDLTVYVGSSTTAAASGRGSVEVKTSSTATVYVKATDANGSLVESYTVTPTYTAPVQTNKAENYAVLFSGGGDRDGNWNTFIVNFGWMYDALTEQYGLPADHIYVLYADGYDSGIDMLDKASGRYYDTDVESFCPGTKIYSATESNLRFVMNELASKTDSNDHVLIYTFDHGADTNPDNSSHHGGEVICPWNPQSQSDYIFAGEFADMAKKINAGYQTYLFAQCYSGGILDALNTSRSGINIYGAAAADHWHSARAGITSTSGGADIAGFNYQMALALTNGVSSTSELTTYAKKNPYRSGDGGYETGSNFQIFAQA